MVMAGSYGLVPFIRSALLVVSLVGAVTSTRDPDTSNVSSTDSIARGYLVNFIPLRRFEVAAVVCTRCIIKAKLPIGGLVRSALPKNHAHLL